MDDHIKAAYPRTPQRLSLYTYSMYNAKQHDFLFYMSGGEKKQAVHE